MLTRRSPIAWFVKSPMPFFPFVFHHAKFMYRALSVWCLVSGLAQHERTWGEQWMMAIEQRCAKSPQSENCMKRILRMECSRWWDEQANRSPFTVWFSLGSSAGHLSSYEKVSTSSACSSSYSCLYFIFATTKNLAMPTNAHLLHSSCWLGTALKLGQIQTKTMNSCSGA